MIDDGRRSGRSEVADVLKENRGAKKKEQAAKRWSDQ